MISCRTFLLIFCITSSAFYKWDTPVIVCSIHCLVRTMPTSIVTPSLLQFSKTVQLLPQPWQSSDFSLQYVFYLSPLTQQFFSCLIASPSVLLRECCDLLRDWNSSILSLSLCCYFKIDGRFVAKSHFVSGCVVCVKKAARTFWRNCLKHYTRGDLNWCGVTGPPTIEGCEPAFGDPQWCQAINWWLYSPCEKSFRARSHTARDLLRPPSVINRLDCWWNVKQLWERFVFRPWQSSLPSLLTCAEMMHSCQSQIPARISSSLNYKYIESDICARVFSSFFHPPQFKTPQIVRQRWIRDTSLQCAGL